MNDESRGKCSILYQSNEMCFDTGFFHTIYYCTHHITIKLPPITYALNLYSISRVLFLVVVVDFYDVLPRLQ